MPEEPSRNPMHASTGAKPEPSANTPESSAPATGSPPTPVSERRKRLRRPLMLALPILLILVAGWFVLRGGRYESTENANLREVRLLIAPDLSGRVVEAHVRDAAAVRQGDTLFVVDEEPLRLALAQADAAVEAARVQVEGLKAAWQAALSRQDLAQSDLDYQDSEARRQTRLTDRGVSSTANLDEQRHKLDQARQALAAAEVGVRNAVAALAGNPEAPVDTHPLVMQALAARDRAAFTLSQARVVAPSDGVIAQAGSFRVGQFVAAGTPVFSLIAADGGWVEANFKETQLEGIAPGQSAEVVFDAFPGRRFSAIVQAITAGTGAEFSLLPAQNATGNWVKVTQRVPVRLVLDEGQDLAGLRSGMSAHVTVDTRQPTRLQELERRFGAASGGNAGPAKAAP